MGLGWPFGVGGRIRARPAIGRKASLLALALVLAVSLLAIYASFVVGAPSLKVEILSWEHIGIDNNEPEKLDTNGNPIGPDQNLVQARITNDGTDPVTNAFARFQWTSANSYVRLADYETYIQHIGNLAPGEYVDVFFQVTISRTILAQGTTRSFSVTATSTETSGIASQTLIVEALAEQGSSSSVVVSAPSTVVLGETFEVVVEAQVTRNLCYESLPLQFDRTFFSLEQVRLDFYGTNDWSGPVLHSENDIFYTQIPSIPYPTVRAYYTLRATRSGMGELWSTQIDSNRNMTSFNYNATMWTGAVDVTSFHAELTISLTDDPDPVPAGGTIAYTATYENVGNDTATNVMVTDYVPANTTYVSGSAYGDHFAIEYWDGVSWSLTEPASVKGLRWNVGTLAPGSNSQEVGFQVLTNSGLSNGTVILNSAKIISDEISSSDAVATTIGPLLGPSVSISKVDFPDAVERGAAITYLITYGNQTASPFTSVVIEDWIPAQCYFVGGSAYGPAGVTIQYYYYSMWNATLPADPALVQAVRWNVGTLNAGVVGQQAGFQTVADYDAPGGTVIANQATSTGIQGGQQTTRTDIALTTTVNFLPTAVSDAYSTNEDTLLNVAAPGVLANDYDSDGGILTAYVLAGPWYGTLTLNEDGSFLYTPGPDFFGTDEFSYRAYDGCGFSVTSPSVVTITISSANDAPSFTKGGDQTVLEDAGSQSVNGWATSISPGPPDESSQIVDFIVSNDNNALFSVQPAVAADGTLTCTPAANANGSATVTVSLHDNGGTGNGGSDTSAPQTFTITVTAVNDVPSFTKGGDQSVLEDVGPQTVNGWATGMSPGPANESSQVLDFIVSNNNNALFSTQPAIAANGTLTYTPAANANGSALVTVSLHDNGGISNGGVDTSGSQTFTITVTAVNDIPSFTKGGDQTVLEDAGSQTVNGWATGISAGPPDESSQMLSFIVGNDNNALFSAQPAIAADGTLTYTPAANANGSATVTVSLHDNGGTGNGGSDTSAPQTFTITVTAVNDVPSFTKGGDQSVLEDVGPQTVNGWATGMSPGPANESSQVLDFIVSNNNNALFSTQPATAANGTLTYTPAANANGSALVTVSLHDNGGISNGGVDTSGSQTFTITVTAVNDAPSFTNAGNQTVLEDSGTQTVSGWASNISAGPADESGQAVDFIVSNNNSALFSVQPAIAANGTLTYTPAANANGSATVTVSLHDNGGTGNGGSDTSAPQAFTITVTAVNDVPSFTKGGDQNVLEDAGPQTVSGWATNISAGPANESSQLLDFIVNNNNNALFSAQPAIAASGVLTYTPAVNANGSAIVTVSLHDNGGTSNGGVDTSAPQTFTITVTAVNDAPSFTNAGNRAVLEDAGPQTVSGWASSISAGPPDESSQIVNFIVGNNNNALFSIQPAVAADGTLTYTPVANASGSATVTVILHDNGGTGNGGADTSAPQTFTIAVTTVNDAPGFTNGGDQSVLEDVGPQTVNGWATGMSPGPANESSQVLDFIVSNNNNALFSTQPAVAANGTLTYTPAANANGSATVTVSLHDNGGTSNGGVDTSAPQTFTITVTAVNDAPGFTKGSDQTVREDAGPQTVSGWATNISAGPANESSQLLDFIVSNNNSALFSVQPAIAANGTLTYTPAANTTGSATVTVSLHDNGGTGNGGVDASGSQTFTITVSIANDPPSFTKGSDQTVLEDAGPQTITGWATDISPGPPDESGQIVNFIVSNNNSALFSVQPAIAANGTLTYTLAANANGSATVTVSLHDNGGTANGGEDTSAPQTFTITVTAVNDVPSFTKGGDQAVLEDAGSQSASGWATGISAGPANESGQLLDFIVSNNNSALFSVQPAIAANGRLTYTLAANANGSATVTVRIHDNGGTGNGGSDTSAPQTFTITVTAVNDVPSFTKGGDQSALDEAGSQTVYGWATNVSAGPANENGQVLNFIVSNNNSALFSVQPAIAANGTLTYTPAANADGSATVTVRIHDNGGTASGGSDTSAAQTFTITISKDRPPVAVDDGGVQEYAYYTEENSSLSVAASGVIANDSDPDGDALSAVLVSPPVNGWVSLGADGSFVYIPNAGFNGTDTFGYQSYDGYLYSNLATVTITVMNRIDFTGLVYDRGGDPVEGVTVSLRDDRGRIVAQATTEPVEWDLRPYPGVYDVVVDAMSICGVTLTFHDIPLWDDLLDVTVVVAPYGSCPYPPPDGGKYVKSLDISPDSRLTENGVTLIIRYGDEELRTSLRGLWRLIPAMIVESSLCVYHWTGSEWQPLPTAVDAGQNLLTVTQYSFSPDGVFGTVTESVPAFPSLPVGLGIIALTGAVAYLLRKRLLA